MLSFCKTAGCCSISHDHFSTGTEMIFVVLGQTCGGAETVVYLKQAKVQILATKQQIALRFKDFTGKG